MHEIDYFNSISEIPDNISSLLTNLKDTYKDYSLEIKFYENNFRITLRELSVLKKINPRRCILVKISENPCSYSIYLYNISDAEEFCKIYEIEVDGENDYRIIVKDIEDIIDGKIGASFTSNFPL